MKTPIISWCFFVDFSKLHLLDVDTIVSRNFPVFLFLQFFCTFRLFFYVFLHFIYFFLLLLFISNNLFKLFSFHCDMFTIYSVLFFLILFFSRLSTFCSYFQQVKARTLKTWGFSTRQSLENDCLSIFVIFIISKVNMVHDGKIY